MNGFIDPQRFIKCWLAVFGAHLFLLLFAILNVYAVLQFVPEPLKYRATNDFLFDLCLIAALLLFGVSLIFGKTFGGFVLSFVFSLLISLLGLVVLFATDSFYFLLWLIIGLSGMGAQLFRYGKTLEKN